MTEEGRANRGLVVASTMLATMLYAIDTTIANVALPHIQGSLQASPDQVLWVLTSYIVMSAIATPLVGFVALRIGERPVLLMSVAGFTIASMLCGIATSPAGARDLSRDSGRLRALRSSRCRNPRC